MKNFRILVLMLSVVLFSCSQEEDTIMQDDSSTIAKSASTARGGEEEGLTEEEVELLTAECAAFSTTWQFQEMRGSAAEFTEKMNGAKPDLSSLEDFEFWLDNNIGLTTFVDTKEGLDKFIDVADRAGVFISANNTFLQNLSGATKEQVAIILQPIHIAEPAPVADSECSETCGAQYLSNYQFNQDVYDYTVANINSSNFTADFKKIQLAKAEYMLKEGIKSSVATLQSCVAGCPK